MEVDHRYDERKASDATPTENRNHARTEELAAFWERFLG